MSERLPRIGVLHYSAPPVIGGVESVMLAHVRLFAEAGYPTTVLAGRGEQNEFPPAVEYRQIPELDSQHPQILEASQELELGSIPDQFEKLVSEIMDKLAPVLASIDILIVHNVFTKHFNLPLTAALWRLLDQGDIRHCIAWCHDLTWSSPRSRSKVYPRYPWGLLRQQNPKINYVTVSRERQRELADLFACPPERIQVIYNGVNPKVLLALSDPGLELINRLNLWDSDLNLLMPIRVTKLKNIELALRVLASLEKRGASSRLVITGPPDPHDSDNMEYFRSLLHLCEELGILEQARFVYESGADASELLTIEMSIVAELLRMSDAILMPSHHEGFGMPILEAGMLGIPVFCADTIPAANEIGGQNVTRFSPDADPDEVADLILRWAEHSSLLHLRRQVRQTLTWRGIFKRQILPLLIEACYEV